MSKSQGMGYITKQQRKKGTYYVGTITLGYDENGKQIRKTKGSYKQKEVKDWLKTNNNKFFSNSSQKTLSECVDNFIETRKKGKVSPLTYERYNTRNRLYIKSKPLGDMEVSKITRSQMQYYADDLIKTASVQIAHEIISLIQSTMRELLNKGEIEFNPCYDIALPPIKKKARTFLSTEEQRTILNELNLNNKNDLAIYLAFCTGCRLGEICGLKWEDIKDGIITINKQFARVVGSEYDIKCTKTETSVRKIPLPPIAAQIIEQYREKGYIFSDNGEKPYDRKRIQNRYKKICNKHNINSSFHCLRHTFATNMVDLNTNPFILRDLLGHKSISTTMIYSHITNTAKKESINKLNNIVSL